MSTMRSYRHTSTKRHQFQRPVVQKLGTRRLSTYMIVASFCLLSILGYFHFSTLSFELAQTLEGALAQIGFQLEDVIVEGRIRTDKTQILNLLNLKHGKPLLSLNLLKAKEKLEKISWVKSARVERRLPNTLFIRISEKEPVSLWRNQGKTYIMDRDGERVETKEPYKYKELIIVTGEQAPHHITELMTLLDKFSELKSRVTAATHLRSTRWNLRLDNKIDVKLPEKEAEKAMAYLIEFTKHHELTNQGIVTIDMRLPGQVILRLPPEGTRQKTGKDA